MGERSVRWDLGHSGQGLNISGLRPSVVKQKETQVWKVGTWVEGRDTEGEEGRESWRILAVCWASLSLEKFLGKMKSFWRRGSNRTCNILSRTAPKGRRSMSVGGWGERRKREIGIRGFPPGRCRQVLPHRRRKRTLEF